MPLPPAIGANIGTEVKPSSYLSPPDMAQVLEVQVMATILVHIDGLR